MNLLNISYPEKFVFGKGALEKFKNDFFETSFKRLFILTIPELQQQLEDLVLDLKQNGITVLSDASIIKEPSFADFEEVLIKAKDFNADSVVGIGGGSALDTAKLIAAQLQNTQNLEEIKGNGNLKERQTYLTCMPTTSGTGSEVSPNALFVDENGQKVGVISPFLVPDAAYVDPKLTISLPPSLTAATGIDALTHCLEAYTNKFSHPFVDLYALEGVRLISKYLLRACTDGNDLEARTQVALGSVYGGMCLGPVNTAAVHALSYPLGVQYHLPHGLSNALLLPFVMEFNIEKEYGKYKEVALAIGAEKGKTDKETALNGVKYMKELIQKCGIELSLQKAGVTKDSIPALATGALKVQRLLKNNVREVTQSDAEAIYKAAF